MKYYEGDIFTAPVDGICHQANLYKKWGSGIVLQIKDYFPEAYEEDQATIEGDLHKLGTFTYASNLNNKKCPRINTVFNIYSQIGFRSVNNQCATHYPSVFAGFSRVKRFIDSCEKSEYVLGIPYKYGCGLAGGRWGAIEDIIEEVFKDWDEERVLICRRPGD